MNTKIRKGIESLSFTERTEAAELFPVKLVGGFIAVDYHVGCVGCSFCISRRHPFLSDLFRSGLSLDSSHLKPDDVFHILSQMKPFYHAKVPVRFGHNTDAGFQWAFGEQLYQYLPADNFMIMLTRFPLNDKQTRLFDQQTNLLLKVTITPPSRILNVSTDVQALIRTIKNVPPENVYVLIGPIVKDNIHQVEPILNQLDAGLWIDIKPLTVEGIPGMADDFLAPHQDIERLRTRAFDQGFFVTDYFGCKLRINFDRPFYKARSSPEYIRRVCRSCKNQDRCFQPIDVQATMKKIIAEGETIGLKIHFSGLKNNTLQCTCDQPTARGDETFLSERVGCGVRFLQTGIEDTACEACDNDILIHRRWENFGMMPYHRIYNRFVESMYDRVKRDIQQPRFSHETS